MWLVAAPIGVVVAVFFALLFRAFFRRLSKRSPTETVSKVSTNTTSSSSSSSVVVIGAGVAGLSCAFELATSSPQCRVTVMESAARCGGMLQCATLDSGKVLELGPRSMRSVGSDNALRALRLIDRLGLASRLRVPAKGVASRRFVWLPPNAELFLMPVSLVAVIRLMFKFNVWPHLLLNDLLLAPLRTLFLRPEVPRFDPSVHAFLSQRVGETAATALGSALVHGVFAGDSRQLSMRQCFPALARITDAHGSLVLGSFVDAVLDAVLSRRSSTRNETPLSPEARAATAARLYSLDGGMQQLPDALVSALRKLPNVTLLTSSRASDIEEHSDRVVVHAGASTHIVADRVVCAVPMHALVDLLPRVRPALSGVTFADVTCVSLVGGERELVPPERAGFGVLAARGACSDPLLLGVIFETCVFASSRNQPPTSVVTVMLGGSNERQDAIRALDDAEVRERALQAVEQIGVKRSEVRDAVIQRWRDAIPQFLANGMDETRRTELRDALRGGRVVLAGAAYGAGVGVPDCIASGLDAAEEIQNYMNEKKR